MKFVPEPEPSDVTADGSPACPRCGGSVDPEIDGESEFCTVCQHGMGGLQAKEHDDER